MKTRFALFPHHQPEYYDIVITDEHPYSVYGQRVLVVIDSGDTVDALSWSFYRIIEASEDELDLLQKMGLHTLFVDSDTE
jgi:hypothetical protein